MLLATSILALTSIIVALVLTPVIRDLFLRRGLVDQPTGGRKIHSTPIPRIGGIVIVASIAVSVGITVALGLWEPLRGDPSLQLVIRLLPAAAVVFLVGLLDDLFDIKPWQKLLGQLMAACVAYAMGLRVMGFAGYFTESWVTLPLTVGWLLVCTNAFNLIDGVDGLAAGAGLFATLTILLAGILEHNTALILAAIPLGAALLGFLRYNFNPATAFLGDSGSLLLGFVLGCFGVIWSFKTATVFGMIAPLMAMSVPILDATLSVARRFLRGRPIFGADRGHVHHRLLDRGHTHRRVVLLLYGACAFGAILSLLQSVQRARYSGVVIFLFCAGTWVCIRRLGYAEFRAVRNMVFGGVLQRTIDINVQLREFETALESCATVAQWWAQLCDQCRSFGFASAKLNFGGQVYDERFAATPGGSWNVVIGLAEGGSLVLAVPRDARRSRSFSVSPARERRADMASARLCSSHSERTASTVMPFVDLISKQLPVGMRVVQNEPAAVALSALDDRRTSAENRRHPGRTVTADLFQVQPFEEQFLEDSIK